MEVVPIKTEWVSCPNRRRDGNDNKGWRERMVTKTVS